MPVSAITPAEGVAPDDRAFIEINAAWPDGAEAVDAAGGRLPGAELPLGTKATGRSGDRVRRRARGVDAGSVDVDGKRRGGAAPTVDSGDEAAVVVAERTATPRPCSSRDAARAARPTPKSAGRTRHHGPAWRPPPLTPPRGGSPLAKRLDRYFDITSRGSSIPTEIRGGAATFLTMAYILFVNPQILGSVAAPGGVKLPFDQLLTVTALVAAVATLAMGIYGRYPFALAAGLGINAFVAFSLVGADRLSWPERWASSSPRA